MRVQITQGGLDGQLGTVIGLTEQGTIRVRLDCDPEGWWVFKVGELKLVGPQSEDLHPRPACGCPICTS